jgi:hypothetical protein
MMYAWETGASMGEVSKEFKELSYDIYSQEFSVCRAEAGNEHYLPLTLGSYALEQWDRRD